QWVFLDLDRLVSGHGRIPRLTYGREIGELRPARGWTQPPHPPSGGALLGVSLRQREWDHADGQQQKHIKCASNKMSFNGGIYLFFHFGLFLLFFLFTFFKFFPRNPSSVYSPGECNPVVNAPVLVKSAEGCQAFFYFFKKIGLPSFTVS